MHLSRGCGGHLDWQVLRAPQYVNPALDIVPDSSKRPEAKITKSGTPEPPSVVVVVPRTSTRLDGRSLDLMSPVCGSGRSCHLARMQQRILDILRNC